jgi:plastocyanin
MNRRITAAVAAITGLGLTIGVTGTATAAKPKPRKNEIRITGGPFFVPGKRIGDDVRFNPNSTVKSGGTIKVVNNGDPAAGPHTISLLKASALPKTMAQAEPCFEFQGVCAPLVAAHQVNPETQEPAVIEYNAGAAGFDTMGDDKTAGDSLFIAPGQKRASFKVTARKGSKLTYFCAVHPWMQGKITVK